MVGPQATLVGVSSADREVGALLGTAIRIDGRAHETERSMKEDALASLADEPLGWQAKGFPVDGRAATLEALRSARLSLFDDGFMTPIATLRGDALDRNIAQMSAFCRKHDVDLAPHGKTTMAPQLFERQIAAGAWGITVATPWQALVCLEFGVERVLLANEIVDPVGIAELSRALDRDENFELLSYVDDAGAVAHAAEVMAGIGSRRPLDVVVEVGAYGGRTGCRDDAAVDEVVDAVQRSPSHRLAGVASYEGLIGDDDSAPVMAELKEFLGRQRRTAERLATEGRFDDARPVVLTAGGSQFFDVVVAELSGDLPGEYRAHVILRSGGYAIHDDTLYGEVSPFTREPEFGGPLEAAVEVWTRVLSRPERGLALLDAGRRDLPFDSGMPRARRVRRGGRMAAADAGWLVRDMNDQHAYLEIADGVELSPGDLVSLSISHPCTLFDKWKWLAVTTDEDVVVDAVRTYF